MERLDRIHARIVSIEELYEIVTAMRSIAATRVQQAQGALGGIRKYVGTVADAIAECTALLAEQGVVVQTGEIERGGRRVVVFCSEHGFAGAFNERLLDAAGALLADDAGSLLMVGGRGSLAAEERSMSLAAALPMATHVDGVLETARRAAAELYAGIEAGEVRQIDVVYAPYEPGRAFRTETLSLLPLDLGPFAARPPSVPPICNLAPQELADKLVGEFVLAELTRTAMESLASENNARLRAMETARRNIEDRLEELRLQERRLRQEQITSETLDVVTGAEALLRP